MDDAFKNLQKDGKNDVENLVKWMKDSKVVEAKEQEDKARALLKAVPDPKNVPLEKFKEILKTLADEFKKNLEGLSSQLADGGPKLMAAAMGGATSALKDLVKK